MHLLGVATPLAKDAHLVGRISDHKTARLGSIGIRPGDALDLTTSHLWIELGPLSQGFTQGDLIPIELVFVRGRIHADAHVRSEEHTSELQSLMLISYAVFCLQKKKSH